MCETRRDHIDQHDDDLIACPHSPTHSCSLYLQIPGDVVQAFWQCASKHESNGHDAAKSKAEPAPAAAEAASAEVEESDPAKRKPKTASVSLISLVVSDQVLVACATIVALALSLLIRLV